jgi:hypothetical protein
MKHLFFHLIIDHVLETLRPKLIGVNIPFITGAISDVTWRRRAYGFMAGNLYRYMLEWGALFRYTTTKET